MEQKNRESIILSYFDMWVNRNFDEISNILDPTIYYSECYGPEYRSTSEVFLWIQDMQVKQTVLEWAVKQFLHQGDTVVVEWFFQDKTDGEKHGFDGVSIIEFGGNGKITSIKEFSSKAEHITPFREKADRIAKARNEMTEPIGYCGHHCTYCFLSAVCGGCRSNHNCCSFATLFDSGTCPNVDCATQRGLEGCYECNDLEGCEKGYYSRTDEYVAKATAFFIRDYGKVSYAATLEKVINAGLDYPKSFDGAGSVLGAYALLQQFIE